MRQLSQNACARLESARMDETVQREFCNVCQNCTNHITLHVARTEYIEELDDNYLIEYSDKYNIMQCRGCDSITVSHILFDGDQIVSTEYYPPRKSRREPKWMRSLHSAVDFFNEDPIYGLLKEIYIALYNQSHRLAAMGIRSLLEHVMIKQCGDQGSFKDNIAAFQKAGFLSLEQQKFLLATIDAGSATAHRSWLPSVNDLNTMMDITENVIETVYVLRARVDELRKNIPARQQLKSRKSVR